MNWIKQLVGVGILAVLSSAGLLAQSIEMRATIPFDFRVGDKTMAAGEYNVETTGIWIVLKASDASGRSTAVMTNAAHSPDSGHAARLVFHRYADSYFLSSVWGPFESDGRELLPSRLEKELAKRITQPSTSIVVARK